MDPYDSDLYTKSLIDQGIIDPIKPVNPDDGDGGGSGNNDG